MSLIFSRFFPFRGETFYVHGTLHDGALVLYGCYKLGVAVPGTSEIPVRRGMSMTVNQTEPELVLMPWFMDEAGKRKLIDFLATEVTADRLVYP